MRFRSVEAVLPSQIVTNEDIVRRVLHESEKHLSSAELATLSDTMFSTFKAAMTEVRYVRAKGERAADLAVQAGERALASAGLKPDQIDLLIYVGVGRGSLEPATANAFQDLLALTRATCFDLLDACASWLRGLELARVLTESGRYSHIMLLNAEFNVLEYAQHELRALEDFEHLFPTYTIGEAATATIVSSGGDDQSFFDFRTYGDLRDLCFIPLPNRSEFSIADESGYAENLRFYSRGRALFLAVMKRGVRQVREMRERVPFAPEICFLHAASDGLGERFLSAVDVPLERGVFTHRRFGNTVSASVPLGMAIAKEEGRLHPGMIASVFVGSAGVTTAVAQFRYLE